MTAYYASNKMDKSILELQNITLVYNCATYVKPCQHIVIAVPYNELSNTISTDTISGATARHIHCVCFTRLTTHKC